MEYTESEPFAFEIGTIIAGRYEVAKMLGSGGMGMVVKVIDRLLDNDTVALKLLYPHLVKDDIVFARFRNEVLVSRRLSHPNIVRLYDFGSVGNGYYYISMEYVPGQNLGSRIYDRTKGKLTVNEAVRYLYKISQGLYHAHQMNVVHRDLKPDNILINEGGEVKVTDFGLARSLIVDKGFTQSGEAVGTPYYMAPEQIRGDKVDTRCDIYALGIMAYEMVMRKRPFNEDAWFNLAAMHLREPLPNFADKNKDIPLWYQEFAQICAAKRPDERYQSMDEVMQVLWEKMTDEDHDRLGLPSVHAISNAPGKKIKRRKKQGKGLSQTLKRNLIWAALVGVVAGVTVLAATLHEGTRQTVGGAVLRAEKSSGADLSGVKMALGTDAKMQFPDLIKHIQSGNAKEVGIQLAAGMNPNSFTDQGMPLLNFAIFSGHHEVVKTLILNSAEVNGADSEGMTPLMAAAQKADFQTVKLLIEKQAYVNARSKAGKTPLIFAIESVATDVVQVLLEAGAYVNIRDELGLPVVLYAVKSGSPGILQLLIDRGADLSVQDPTGSSLLHFAAESGSVPMMRALIHAGVPIDKKNQNGAYPLDSLGVDERKMLTAYAKSLTSETESEAGLKTGFSTTKAEVEPKREVEAPPSASSPVAPAEKLTTLRTRGAPEGTWMSQRGVTKLTKVRISVKNITDTTATGVKVQVVSPDGSLIDLTGPTDLEGYADAWYEATTDIVVTNTRRLVAKPSCANCRN